MSKLPTWLKVERIRTLLNSVELAYNIEIINSGAVDRPVTEPLNADHREALSSI
jgi:hypothetical protein